MGSSGAAGEVKQEAHPPLTGQGPLGVGLLGQAILADNGAQAGGLNPTESLQLTSRSSCLWPISPSYPVPPPRPAGRVTVLGRHP